MTDVVPGVVVERLVDGAGELHLRSPEVVDGPAVWWCEVDRPAVVLGSRQDPALLDAQRCAARGIEIVRRRSGGGLVLLVPDEFVWVDLLVPPGAVIDGVDPDDPRSLMVAAGRWWRTALVHLGDDPGLAVHDGGMVVTPWSDLICFAGLGPGEVVDEGAKLVGLSQRRGRWGARIQGALHRRVDLERTASLLAGVRPDAPLPVVASRPGLDVAAVVASLAASFAAALGGSDRPA